MPPRIRSESERFPSLALGMISCPVLLVRGTCTDILTKEMADEMVSMVKIGRLVELNDT